MKKKIDTILRMIRSYIHYRRVRNHYKCYLQKSGYPNKPMDGELEYKKKWKKLSKRIEPYSYRFFSHYCGQSPDIVPENIGNTFIEKKLNPPEYRATYADKNMFKVILGADVLPKTLLCRIKGGPLLNGDYRPVLEANFGGVFSWCKQDALILKPCVGSCSGKGIIRFNKRDDGFFVTSKGDVLTKNFLMNYGNDFCLQECIRQSDFTAQFNPSSVNTIRIAIYKSVVDDDVHVIGAIIRMGKAGAMVDNAHAGGVFAGIDVETGKLGKYATNEYGEKFMSWNGANFEKVGYQVPNWNNVLQFCKKIGERLLHLRLVALDIALDKDNNPILIEYNLGAFSYWLFMLTGHTPLGKYTDEIIEYCKE